MKEYNKHRKERLLSSLGLEDGRDPIYVINKSQDKYISYSIMVVVFTLVVLFHSLFMWVTVSGNSMSHTLKDGQRVLVSRTEKVRRFDIVVLNERLVDGGDSLVVIKRVIGMPGDRVTVVNGELFINNRKYTEDYLSDSNIKTFKNLSFTIDVPKGHVFVLGDNRDVSKDSRAVGSYKLSAIMGVKLGND